MRLNLGCGTNHYDDCLNVDKWGKCDRRYDLEQTPWLWQQDNSVSTVKFDYSLTQLGQTFDQYCRILQELYRVCKDGARIEIAAYHPRSDYFFNDPASVRAVTPDSLTLLSQKAGQHLIDTKAVQQPLGMRIGVDFRLTDVSVLAAPEWQDSSEEEIKRAAAAVGNVIIEYKMVMVCKK
jgi:hypothetical protein